MMNYNSNMYINERVIQPRGGHWSVVGEEIAVKIYTETRSNPYFTGSIIIL